MVEQLEAFGFDVVLHGASYRKKMRTDLQELIKVWSLVAHVLRANCCPCEMDTHVRMERVGRACRR